MPIQKLNPDLPERMQLEQIKAVDAAYERYMEHYSRIAEAAFVENRDAWKFALSGPSVVARVEPGDRLPDGADTAPPPERPAQASSEPVRRVATVTVGPLDPRLPPFDGSPEKLAAHIGTALATAICNQAAMLADKHGGVEVRRSEVKVFAEIPTLEARTPVRGMILDENRPLLKGRLDATFLHSTKA